jgi:hypothetical protein
MTDANVERFHVPAEVRLERIAEDAETVSEINEAIQVLAEFLDQCLIDDDCEPQEISDAFRTNRFRGGYVTAIKQLSARAMDKMQRIEGLAKDE